MGRDLLLQSQQDSDNYDSKQTSISGGVSVAIIGGGGSVNLSMSRDKLHSNYDSVQEQTGIFVGKGGFDITVGEHTQLDGAVIASTATADKNTLDTGTLGFSNIGNKADFKVEHQSVGISTGGNIGGQFVGNMANGLLVGANNEGHADSTTHAAVSDGTITVRDTDKQQQNVADLSRDVEHANNALSPIFDKEKEQNRLREAQLIGEIGSQVSDVIRTQGDINGLKAAKEKLGPLKENATEKDRAEYMEKLRNSDVYKDEMKKNGTGSALQQGVQAATAAIQGLAGGDMAKALAGASAPYLAEVIHNMTTDANGKVNVEANLMAHAVLGAVMAQVNGNSALAGASGAVMGEYIVQQMYPGINREDLTEEQRQTISALGTLASGLAGGLAGGSTADAVAGAQAGKNALENNFLLQILVPPPPVAGQAPQSEANTIIAQKLDAAVKEFGRDVVKQCLSGGDCPMPVQIALLAIQTIMGQGDNGLSNTGGDQITGSGPTDTGGDQLPGQGVNHTGNNTGQVDAGPSNTGRNQTVGTSSNNTGNTEAVPDLPNHMTSDGHDNGAEKPSNIKVADDKFLKNNGVDAHQIKKDFLGAKAEIKLYDIYVDKGNGQLWIFRKGGKGEGIPTGEFINK
ncbi:Putative large exoprotein involved in heme utilization or adhesion of ShlA/HecA/FhaA family [Yersinia enterocolitica]|nr:Putative large exoprotein involved in heme utilization or adhesion of ShlA/HecA/FhaA family [Yersinia enterocolitica]